MSGAVVSQKTADDVARFAKFFGVDLEWSRHIFSYAARADGESFARVMALFREAIEQDSRFGVEERIRRALAADRASGKRVSK